MTCYYKSPTLSFEHFSCCLKLATPPAIARQHFKYLIKKFQMSVQPIDTTQPISQRPLPGAEWTLACPPNNDPCSHSQYHNTLNIAKLNLSNLDGVAQVKQTILKLVLSFSLINCSPVHVIHAYC